jgi:putative ABC transport system ATP-binding protein
MTILELKNLAFESQGKIILDNINYSVNEGEFLSIMGPSGSGKSTLLKIISSIISKTSGDILYKNKPIEEYDPSDYRKEVSYCFQSPVLFGKTVEDNLTFPYAIRNEKFDNVKAIKFLEEVGLTEEYLSKPINTLSGGEKQRVAIIRNVLYQPKMLLLDEITSALDQANREIIWNWLKSLKKKSIMTVLMVSHNEEELELADKSIKIIDGKLIKIV